MCDLKGIKVAERKKVYCEQLETHLNCCFFFALQLTAELYTV